MVCIITFDCFMTCCASSVIAMQANLQALAEAAVAICAARRRRLCPNLPMINEHCLTGIQNDSNSFTNDCVSLLHKHHLCFLGTSSSKLTGASLLHVKLEQAKPSPALPIHNGAKISLKFYSYINIMIS